MSRKTHPGLSQLFRGNPLLGLFVSIFLPPLWVRAEQCSHIRAEAYFRTQQPAPPPTPAVLGSYQTQRDNLSSGTHSPNCTPVQAQGLKTREEVETVQMGDWGLGERNHHLLWPGLGQCGQYHRQFHRTIPQVFKRPSLTPCQPCNPGQAALPSLVGFFTVPD